MKIIHYPPPREDIDYSTDKNDIRNLINKDLVQAYNSEEINYVVNANNEKYHLKVHLDDMREINFSCDLILKKYNLPRIIYLGNEEYYYHKEIFQKDVYKELLEKYNNSREFILYVISVSHKPSRTPELYTIKNTDYKLIEKNRTFENTFDDYYRKACAYGEFCELMRGFLKKYHCDKLYVKKTIRYYKAHMIHFMCDKCNKSAYEYNRSKGGILFTTFYTSRSHFDIEDEDNYYYKDKDNTTFYIQGDTVDLCEDCFEDLPRSLIEAEKRLSIVKVMRHYNISNYLTEFYFGE